MILLGPTHICFCVRSQQLTGSMIVFSSRECSIPICQVLRQRKSIRQSWPHQFTNCVAFSACRWACTLHLYKLSIKFAPHILCAHTHDQKKMGQGRFATAVEHESLGARRCGRVMSLYLSPSVNQATSGARLTVMVSRFLFSIFHV